VKPEPTGVPTTTGTTVEYQVSFATGTKGRKRVRTAAAIPAARAVPLPVAPPPRPPAPESPAPRTVPVLTPEIPPPAALPSQGPRIPKITLLLVLGHHFERLVRDGVVRDYAEIARRTGLTRARVTQITGLTLLAPEVQEALLNMKRTAMGEDPVNERRLRAMVGKAGWGSQRLAGEIRP